MSDVTCQATRSYLQLTWSKTALHTGRRRGADPPSFLPCRYYYCCSLCPDLRSAMVIRSVPSAGQHQTQCISALFYDLYGAGRRFAAITFIASYHSVTVITVMSTDSVRRVGSFFLWTGLLYILSSLPVCLPVYVDCKTVSVVSSALKRLSSELTVYPVWHEPTRTDNPP